VTQSPSPAEGPAFAASASASAPRESRALREARDDLRRLETRRDELLEKKKRLRAFLTPARESARERGDAMTFRVTLRERSLVSVIRIISSRSLSKQAVLRSTSS
jgi:hypothetical protein